MPSKCRAILLGSAAGIFLACSLASEEQEGATATPPPEKQAPHLLLAKVWDSSIDPTGWWMSEKYDGLRGYWDGRKLWSQWQFDSRAGLFPCRVAPQHRPGWRVMDWLREVRRDRQHCAFREAG